MTVRTVSSQLRTNTAEICRSILFKFNCIMSACISLKFTLSLVKNHSLQKNCCSIVLNGTSQFYNADKWDLNNSFLLLSYIISILMHAPRGTGPVH